MFPVRLLNRWAAESRPEDFGSTSTTSHHRQQLQHRAGHVTHNRRGHSDAAKVLNASLWSNSCVPIKFSGSSWATIGLSCLMGSCSVGPSQAALLQQQVVLLDSNAAIVSQLKQLQQTKQKFGKADPGSALAARFMGAQQQLQRIELLVSIQQYDNARMQLRQGSFKSLRSDLRYESEYRGVQPELSRGIIDGVEKLDRLLRGQEPKESVVQDIRQLQQQLQQLVDAAKPPAE